jgi:hypothetical protein
VNVEEINAVIDRALTARPPKWEDERTPPRVKVSELEDYLMASAYLAAELEAAHHWLSKAIDDATDVIAEMHGYEALLPSKPRDRITAADHLAAKREANPDPFLAGAEAKRLRATVLRQIDRLKFEAQWVISRSYSMISGS